jgi:integrase/transposase-like protein
MVAVEETVRVAPQNNVKPEISSLLLDSGSRLPVASASSNTATTTIRCPECGSQRVWKDGLRYSRRNNQNLTQRYLCRDCGLRFSPSEPYERLQKIQRQILSCGSALPFSRQVCVSQTKAMINLAEVESQIQEQAAGAIKPPDPATLKGLIIQYAFWLKKRGNTSPEYPRILQRLAKRGANLLDPESVKESIAKHQCKNGTKLQEVYAYDAFAKMLKIQWERPHYVQEDHLPFIPEERELDQLIAACRSKRMATFLQTLKETFADPTEALRIQWIDLTGNVITINSPVKGHKAGSMTISNRLIAMLSSLPRTSERIFPTTYDSMASSFQTLRKRAAEILKNPRINAISFTTFRHWGATMTYHYTKNILLVKDLLRHKSLDSTMKYTRLIQFKDDDYEIAAATTLEEDTELLKVGFEYVTERNSIKLYRKPKAFGNLVNKREVEGLKV